MKKQFISPKCQHFHPNGKPTDESRSLIKLIQDGPESESIDLAFEQFAVGDPVVYIPNHADNEIEHPDCEHGIVSRVNYDDIIPRIWVRYTIGETGALTPIANLRKK